MSILIEHTAGKFPLWLTPEQYVLLPVSDRHIEYCNRVKLRLSEFDIRGTVDARSESIGRKIRDNELKKIPLLLICGDKEEADQTVSVRIQGGGDKGSMTIPEFAAFFKVLAEQQ